MTYISPITWFIVGIYEDTVGQMVSCLISGLSLTFMAYMLEKIIRMVKGSWTRDKGYYDDCIALGEGVGMIKALEHFKNGGTLEALILKSKSKVNQGATEDEKV